MRGCDRRLAPAALVGATFALTTLLDIAFHVGEILFTDHDPHAPVGPIVSIESVAFVGVLGLIVAWAIAVPLSRDPARAKTGAIVLGALTVLSLPVLWSGASATLGAAAARPSTRKLPRPEPLAAWASSGSSARCSSSSRPCSVEPRDNCSAETAMPTTGSRTRRVRPGLVETLSICIAGAHDRGPPGWSAPRRVAYARG